jgi:hypothetical protein
LNLLEQNLSRVIKIVKIFYYRQLNLTNWKLTLKFIEKFIISIYSILDKISSEWYKADYKIAELQKNTILGILRSIKYAIFYMNCCHMIKNYWIFYDLTFFLWVAQPLIFIICYFWPKLKISIISSTVFNFVLFIIIFFL